MAEAKQPEGAANGHGAWASIITAVTTPLGLFALLVLVLESILGVVATRAEGRDFTILVYGMVGTLILLVLIFAAVLIFRPGAITQPAAAKPPPGPPAIAVADKFDVFLSAPMAAAKSETDYETIRRDVLAFMRAIKDYLRLERVYFAGESIASKKEFDAQVLAVQDDFDNIRQSKIFVMLYPAPLVSSVLVEIGFALALQKPTLVFAHQGVGLPFLLRQAGQALRHVRTYEVDDNNAAIELLRRSGAELIPPPAASVVAAD